MALAGGQDRVKVLLLELYLKANQKKNIAIIEQDSYYKDQGHLSFEERIKTNYDHPLSFDTELLIEHLNMLLQNKGIHKPLYDFEMHTRKKETEFVAPRDIIILEGIMILDDPSLRSMLDIKIFVDTDADVRNIRRIVRDINERGRTLESVIEQYLTTVRPAHLQFVEPNKKYADIIIPEGGFNQVAIDIMIAKIQSIINGRSKNT